MQKNVYESPFRLKIYQSIPAAFDELDQGPVRGTVGDEIFHRHYFLQICLGEFPNREEFASITFSDTGFSILLIFQGSPLKEVSICGATDKIIEAPASSVMWYEPRAAAAMSMVL